MNSIVRAIRQRYQMPLYPPAGGGSTQYPAGTVPTVIQSGAASLTLSCAVTLGSAPTLNNLLVAIVWSASALTPQSGWTVVANNTSGDACYLLTKTAGASESATQTPMSTPTGAAGVMMWELASSLSTTPVLEVGVVPAPDTSTVTNAPTTLPNNLNCIGLTGLGSITNKPSALYNVGTLDQNIAAGTGLRAVAGSHTDFSKTPLCGMFATYATATTSKTVTALVSS